MNYPIFLFQLRTAINPLVIGPIALGYSPEAKSCLYSLAQDIEQTAVVPDVWFLYTEHQYNLGTHQKCKFSGTTPDLLNQKL